MRPWEVARLTDHQIVHCYLLPQARRNEAMKNRKGEDQPELEDESDPTSMPRKLMVENFMRFGMSRQAAEAEYDNQLRMNAMMQRKTREQDNE
jgi:hypothetical protein